MHWDSFPGLPSTVPPNKEKPLLRPTETWSTHNRSENQLLKCPERPFCPKQGPFFTRMYTVGSFPPGRIPRDPYLHVFLLHKTMVVSSDLLPYLLAVPTCSPPSDTPSSFIKNGCRKRVLRIAGSLPSFCTSPPSPLPASGAVSPSFQKEALVFFRTGVDFSN